MHYSTDMLAVRAVNDASHSTWEGGPHARSPLRTFFSHALAGRSALLSGYACVILCLRKGQVPIGFLVSVALLFVFAQLR